MSKPIKWGILGAAKFAREHMAPAIHAAQGAELAGLATSDPAKAAPFQAFCPGLTVHDSYEALLADDSIDVVYIPLPNHLHVEWTLKALAAGKNVLCEKPITLRAAEFDQLIAAREASGKLAAEAYMIVHHPQWQRARDMVEAGAIGEVRHVTGAFAFDNRTDVTNIRNKPETGGGALRDIGVYIFGAARYVLGEEARDIAARVDWDNGVDSFADVQARLGEATYSAYVSIRMHPYQEMCFHGEKGVLRLTAPFNARVFGEARIEWHKPGLIVETIRFPSANHYQLQVEAFCASVRDGTYFPGPLEFSRGTQEMMDAVFAAGELGADL